MDLRRIEFEAEIYENMKAKRKNVKGYFHKWADSYSFSDDDRKIPITVGICEREKNGKIYEIEPRNIKFLDRDIEELF